MSQYAIRPLDSGTWDAFVRLCEKYNGCGFGGCWCTWFHLAVHGAQGATARSAEKGSGAEESGRALKERLVREGKAHAALVFDGDDAVGWCEFGTPTERLSLVVSEPQRHSHTFMVSLLIP